jgi:hypothetical protein
MQDTLTDSSALADLFKKRSGLSGLSFCARLDLSNDLQRNRLQARFAGDFYVTCPVIEQALLWPELQLQWKKAIASTKLESNPTYQLPFGHSMAAQLKFITCGPLECALGGLTANTQTAVWRSLDGPDRKHVRSFVHSVYQLTAS